MAEAAPSPLHPTAATAPELAPGGHRCAAYPVRAVKLRHTIMILAIIAAGGCAGVRQEDTQAWVGAPAPALETHPVFISMPVIRTTTSDGTEIWNYVNGRDIATCGSGGSVFTGSVDFATYNSFTSCMKSFQACNNIFIIKNGRVVQYSPVGSGGSALLHGCWFAAPRFHWRN